MDAKAHAMRRIKKRAEGKRRNDKRRERRKKRLAKERKKAHIKKVKEMTRVVEAAYRNHNYSPITAINRHIETRKITRQLKE